MDASNKPEQTQPSRRRFLGTAGTAAVAAGALQLGLAGPAAAQAVKAKAGGAAGPATAGGAGGSSFGPIQQTDAGVLNIGYVDLGPTNGTPVILMHGFPYDIHSYEKVAPLLAAQGYRCIVPYSRGYGTTTFLSAKTPRNADQAAWALDILALMDALHIDSAIMAGFDWGSRTGDIIAALWPNRVKALVSVTGYLIKDSPTDEFAKAVQQIRSGRRYIDPQLALNLAFANNAALSARERRIIEMLLEDVPAAVPPSRH